MKLFGLNISKASTVPEIKSVPTQLSDWLRGTEVNGGAVFTNAYQQVVWVYRAINVLAEQVANVPFLFSTGERGRERLITNGPLLRFYANPHPQISRFEYWELRIIWLMLRGECFRVPIYEDAPGHGGRRLSRVLILDPAHFQHIVHDNELVGWRFTGWGSHTPLRSQVFLPEEVWFEKLPNPFDFWRGLAPLHAAAGAVKTDFAAAAFMRGVIENNGDAGVMVRTEKPLSPEQQEQLFAALRERKRQAGIADRPVLLSGCAEIIKPQLSSSDLQFLENRKFSRGEICAAFGVPEEIVTTTDTAKYDVMEGARLNFIENRIAPLCGRLEAEEDKIVKALDSQAVGWFDLESLPLVQKARRERLLAARAAFEMGVPFNELNRVLDLGFKALPWGDKGYVPARMKETAATNAVPGQADKSADERTHRTELWVENSLGFLHGLEQPAAKASPANSLKLPVGKLRKYFIEQRGRLLTRVFELVQSDERNGSDGAWLKQIFELDAENELLTSHLKQIGPFAEDPSLAGACTNYLKRVNADTATQLEATLRVGRKQNESRDQLLARARGVLNATLKKCVTELETQTIHTSSPEKDARTRFFHLSFP